ncbi:hypothetical protein NE575_20135, partial [Clostridium sp. SL.3.18]|nr:hypothetical protein [Clostridium sp. SL.3.18]
QMIWRNGRVTGSNGHAGDAIFKNVIGLIASRRFDYRKLITGRYTLDEAEQAIIDTQKASGGKNLIICATFTGAASFLGLCAIFTMAPPAATLKDIC